MVMTHVDLIEKLLRYAMQLPLDNVRRIFLISSFSVTILRRENERKRRFNSRQKRSIYE